MLVLVNRDHPYRDTDTDMDREKDTDTSTAETLTPIGKDGVLLAESCATALKNLMDDLGAWGQIVIVSGWRSQQEQKQIYNDSLANNGADFTAKYVALPGHSEHQTGLAVDLALNLADIDALRPHFPYTGICGAFRERAPLYGFIERYPLGKEAITGIAHEPWHFRYVGTPHAEEITRRGVTLEEYLK